MGQQYQKAVLGGTFDLLHIGHKKLLNEAFASANLVSIGLTTDTFNQKRHKKTFENFPVRKNNLLRFLHQSGFINRFKIVPIVDIYGNANTDPALEVILVTPETIKNAQLINQKRLAQTLSPLKIITVGHLLDQSGQIISSTRIRQGETSPEGVVYQFFLSQIAGKPIPDSLNKQLKKPLGSLVQSVPQKTTSQLITVGDITTQNFLSKNQTPNLAVIDLKTNRQITFTSLSQLGFDPALSATVVTNSPGQISLQLINQVKAKINSPETKIIQINGEEDLAVLPIVLLSPLGSRVFYGQPDAGLVSLTVNPTTKQKIYQLLSLIN